LTRAARGFFFYVARNVFRGLRFDPLAPAEIAELLVGLGFDVDPLDRQIEIGCDMRPHPFDMRRQLRRLRDHAAIHVGDRKARRLHARNTLAQQHPAVRAGELRIGVGEMAADIA
jgi:hypothetical protein